MEEACRIQEEGLFKYQSARQTGLLRPISNNSDSR